MGMNKCKKNILLIFGYLLFVAFLIVPYSSFTTEEKRLKDGKGAHFSDYFEPTNYEMVEISHSKSGWVFSPYMLISKRRFFINWNTLAVETAVILLIAGFAYIIFCITVKKGG